MKLEEHILLWNHAAVKILDIRHVIMEPGELLESYLLPQAALFMVFEAQQLCSSMAISMKQGAFICCMAVKGCA